MSPLDAYTGRGKGRGGNRIRGCAWNPEGVTGGSWMQFAVRVSGRMAPSASLNGSAVLPLDPGAPSAGTADGDPGGGSAVEPTARPSATTRAQAAVPVGPDGDGHLAHDRKAVTAACPSEPVPATAPGDAPQPDTRPGPADLTGRQHPRNVLRAAWRAPTRPFGNTAKASSTSYRRLDPLTGASAGTVT